MPRCAARRSCNRRRDTGPAIHEDCCTLRKERIRADFLAVGDTVPCDIYSTDGRLLLSRGHVVESDGQLERLVSSGLYDPAALDERGFVRAGRTARPVSEFSRLPSQLARDRVSIFGRLTQVAGQLDALFANAFSGTDFAEGMRSAASNVRECCVLDGDAALAQILLSDGLRYSIRHPTNVAVLTTILCNRLHHDEARSAAATGAALTMNMCFVALQETLAHQKEALTAEQRAEVRKHPHAAAQALRDRGIADPHWLQAVAQHHEARDGSGYPDGLKSESISREAQIVALADRYCALVSARAYRPAFSPRRAIKELHDRAGLAIDPALIGTLISAIGIFPPGAYVRLSNGETGVVVRRLHDPKHPVVYALHQDTTVPYDTPRKRLTASHRDFEIAADVRPEAVRVKIDPELLWPPSATGDALKPAP